jgi:hypothetical protein
MIFVRNQSETDLFFKKTEYVTVETVFDRFSFLKPLLCGFFDPCHIFAYVVVTHPRHFAAWRQPHPDQY